MITREELNRKFPIKVGKYTTPMSGRIPMDYFEANEKEIRALFYGLGVRYRYRGPRTVSQYSTLRKDATAVVIY